MGLFIDVYVDPVCATRPACRECVQVCPVDIFARAGEEIAAVIAANEDECILCDLCVVGCPVDAITITRLYATGDASTTGSATA